MEPITMAASAYALDKSGAKDIAVRLFGPLADKLGEDIKDLYSVIISNNIRNLWKFTAQKLTFHNIDKKDSTQLSIFNEIMSNGLFQEGEIFAEYYGGVIAASRMNQSDIGKAICQTITRLPTYALRLHFIIYNALKNTYSGKTINLGEGRNRSLCRIFIKRTDLNRAMGFTEEESGEAHLIYGTCLNALIREDLLGKRYYLGDKKDINDFFTMSEGGLIVGPSYAGASLLSWAAGYGILPPELFFSHKREFSPHTLPLLSEISIPPATKIPSSIPTLSDAREQKRLEELRKYILED